MKKLLSVLTVFVVLLSVFFSFEAFGDEQESIPLTRLYDSDTYYSYDSDTKTLTISGEGAMPDLANSGTASNAQPWYYFRSSGDIEKVVVGNGITVIGAYAFYYVSASEIVLPDTLTRLRSYSFAGTNGLSSFDIPQGVTNVDSYAFYGTRNISSLTIPSSVKSISNSAFESCRALSSVVFEKTNMTVSLGLKCFLNCPELTALTLPRNVRLSNYSVGYSKASAGSVNTNMTLSVFRDSPAYDYAVGNNLSFELINNMALSVGDTAQREYLSSTLEDVMTFTFTPENDGKYDLFSTGAVDVDCVLKDSEGTVIAECADISGLDLNFLVTADLAAGEEYVYSVNSVHSQGVFDVTLLPYNTALVTGKVINLKSENSVAADAAVVNAGIVCEGVSLANTDFQGAFCAFIPLGSSACIHTPSSVDRTLVYTPDLHRKADIGTVTLLNFDYCRDGYINAKDYAVLDNGGRALWENFNISDFSACGKITESVYN